MKTKRKVWIDSRNNCCYFVRYLERRKYQRHCAAQFDPRVRTIAQVAEWIEANGFELVDPPAVA